MSYSSVSSLRGFLSSDHLMFEEDLTEVFKASDAIILSIIGGTVPDNYKESPAILQVIGAQIAIYNYNFHRPDKDDNVMSRYQKLYDNAIKMLELIASGTIKLPGYTDTNKPDYFNSTTDVKQITDIVWHLQKCLHY